MEEKLETLKRLIENMKFDAVKQISQNKLSILNAMQTSGDDPQFKAVFDKIDEALNTGVEEIMALDIQPQEDYYKTVVFATIRLAEIGTKTVAKVNLLMTNKDVTSRLRSIQMQQQDAIRMMRQRQEARDAVDPSNFSGSAEDLKGAESVKFTKVGDGAPKITPVE